jgi:hypothetical protein
MYSISALSSAFSWSHLKCAGPERVAGHIQCYLQPTRLIPYVRRLGVVFTNQSLIRFVPAVQLVYQQLNLPLATLKLNRITTDLLLLMSVLSQLYAACITPAPHTAHDLANSSAPAATQRQLENHMVYLDRQTTPVSVQN